MTNDEDETVEAMHHLTALQFISSELSKIDQPDMIDFDDFGTPVEEVNLFLKKYLPQYKKPFVLCITDGLLQMLKRDIGGINKFGIDNEDAKPARHFIYMNFEKILVSSVFNTVSEMGWSCRLIDIQRSGSAVYHCYKLFPPLNQ